MSNYRQATVSEELEATFSREDILRTCARLWPGQECDVIVHLCPTCRGHGYRQHQAKVMISDRCMVKGGCENTEEEALAKLLSWVQNLGAYRAERFHA